MSRTLVCFDDDTARGWLPFTLTRPAGELRYGIFTLRERAERVFDLPCAGHLTEPHLGSYDEPWAPGVLALDDIPGDDDVLFLSSRVVPAWQPTPALGSGATLLAVNGVVCGWFAPAGTERPDTAFLAGPDAAAPDLPVQELDGGWLTRPWDLIHGSPEQIGRDAGAVHPGPERTSRPANVHMVGGHALVRSGDVRVDPGVVLDLTRGPVWLEAGVTVRAFTHLSGPSFVARDSTLLGGSLDGVTLGPRSKVRGEVEESIFLGYSNKAHDGFLGHALVGMWVNLGALTTNSDLKNNYGTVRMWTPEGVVDSGSLKLGCLIGDHVKTAIGTMIGTGTVIGAGSNLYGDTRPPTYVPDFSWGGAGETAHRMDEFLETTERAMARRDVVLSDAQRAMLTAAWERTRGS